jgi:hypothetical protein
MDDLNRRDTFAIAMPCILTATAMRLALGGDYCQPERQWRNSCIKKTDASRGNRLLDGRDAVLRARRSEPATS